MCNVPVRGGQRPYGRDALVAVPSYEYGEGENYGLTDDPEPTFEEEESEYANIHTFTHAAVSQEYELLYESVRLSH